eukprot:GCRY01003921.1.p1 GENE.GCRY01003921.1~~GCRY01003921.1.p1  ORF type:complete len:292 (+),score=72.33 GCRY01003921.1:124-999(+)
MTFSNSSSILFQHPSLEAKIQKFKQNFKDLMIIADFDSTLTEAFNEKGERASNSFSVFMNNPTLLGPAYVDATRKNFEKYYPIERSHDLPLDKKSEAMEEWWKSEFALYKTHGMTTATIKDVVEKNLIHLRQDVKEFFHKANSENIPFFILSAGVANIIEGIISNLGEQGSNVHVVSNALQFASDGRFEGLRQAIIHCENKDSSYLSQNAVYVAELERKDFAIILGDSLSDIKMGNDFPKERCLSIGIFNKVGSPNATAELQKFKDTFDIVLDGHTDGFAFPFHLLTHLAA